MLRELACRRHFDVTNDSPTEEQGTEAPFFYVNQVAISVGAFDVTMDFSYQAPEDRVAAAEAGTQVYSPRVVRLAMSHGHAKSMIPVIAGLVANLESTVGTIPTPGFDEKSKE